VSIAFHFDPEWRTTVFALVMVPLMAGLGVWQLSRAEEKADLRNAFDAQQARPPALLADLADATTDELAYLPVQLTGTFRKGH
jgi:surfeit locus 1 family protein